MILIIQGKCGIIFLCRKKEIFCAEFISPMQKKELLIYEQQYADKPEPGGNANPEF